MRNYGFDFDDDRRRILYIKERREVRNDVDSEVLSIIPIALSWIGFVPSSLALSSVQYIMWEMPDQKGEVCHDFGSYFLMLVMFTVLCWCTLAS